jgi:aminopeptidase N
MLRIAMGDEAFFGGLQHYLKQYEFDNVVSTDLQKALEESSNLDLDWFFDEWVNGGGHPQFEISYRYHEQPGLIDLEVRQIQPIIEGQDLFHLPVNITISAGGNRRTEQIQVGKATEHFIIKSAARPDMLSFDGAGALVADILFDKPAGEWAYQATNDALAGRFRAINGLATVYPRAAETYRTFSNILAGDAYWADQAEVASLAARLDEKKSLKLIKSALKNTDYRIRKGAVIALGQLGSPAGRRLLKQVVKKEIHPDVLATAINHSESAVRIDHLDHKAWYDEITIGALEGLAGLEGPADIRKVAAMTTAQYNMDVRIAALRAWSEAAPDDPDLRARIESMAQSDPYPLQKEAIMLSGELGIAAMMQFLEDLIERKIDPNLTKLAKQAVESIRRITVVDE